MRVILVSSSVPHVVGGATLIVEWTAQAMRERGHQVEEYFLPFPTQPRESLAAIAGMRAVPFAGSGDRLVAFRWPAHVVRHENKATWFIHHYRALFDLWDTPYRAVGDDPAGRAYREAFRRIDNIGLSESRDLFSNSLVVRDRIRTYNGLDAEPLFPPLGGDTTRFRTDEYGDFVFYPSRVTPIKRQMLAVRAMRETTSGVRLVIGGVPEPATYGNQIHDYVREHRLEDKVELRFGWLPEEQKTDLMARCLALVYTPVAEDSYGYTSLEAALSAKPIVTVTDAGGALEFARDGVEGLVTPPTPGDLARAFDRLYEDRAEARRMGEAALARPDQLGIDWDHVVARLVGTAG